MADSRGLPIPERPEMDGPEQERLWVHKLNSCACGTSNEKAIAAGQASVAQPIHALTFHFNTLR